MDVTNSRVVEDKGLDMRLGALTAIFASVLLLSGAALADETAAPAPAPTAAPTTAAAPATTPATNVDDTVTCRYEAETGSNFKKRICHTQREWKQMTTDAHDLMDRLDTHGGLGGPGGN
ncbi:MAG: hypothetical protein ISR49_01300 [Alphaproteobacteria bacterium]|nr:hypothetical protein [Alphaproteobacteria bacterium]